MFAGCVQDAESGQLSHECRAKQRRRSLDRVAREKPALGKPSNEEIAARLRMNQAIDVIACAI
jgi:hypothetical protein